MEMEMGRDMDGEIEAQVAFELSSDRQEEPVEEMEMGMGRDMDIEVKGYAIA
jgi:hypothetical protein